MGPFLGTRERLILVRDGYYGAGRRTSRRAAMLLALDRGETPSAVARAVRCARTTVYYWLHRYLQHRDVCALRGGKLQGREQTHLRMKAVNQISPGKGRRLGGLSREGRLRQQCDLISPTRRSVCARRYFWRWTEGRRSTEWLGPQANLGKPSTRVGRGLCSSRAGKGGAQKTASQQSEPDLRKFMTRHRRIAKQISGN